MPRYYYATVIDALQKLKEKGYETDFNLQENALVKNPENYKITKIYRYEGDTDPDEEAFVFGIKSKSGEKGVYVMGAAANSEGSAGKFLLEIAIKKRD